MSTNSHADNLSSAVRYALETTCHNRMPFPLGCDYRVRDDAAESHAFARARKSSKAMARVGRTTLSCKSSDANSAKWQTHTVPVCAFEGADVLRTAKPRRRKPFAPGATSALPIVQRSAETVQEHSQMITNAIGRPAPKAPAIISANAESKFASGCISRPDMPLLHQAPTGIRPSPKDERSKKQVSGQGRRLSSTGHLPEPERSEAQCLWLKQG